MDPAAADQAERMGRALDRHAGLIQRLLAGSMPLKFAMQLKFKKWLGARPADLLQQAALARRAAADPDAWEVAKSHMRSNAEASGELLGESAVVGGGMLRGDGDGAGLVVANGQQGAGADIAPWEGVVPWQQRRRGASPRAGTSLLRRRVKEGLDGLQEARALRKKKGAGLGPRRRK